MSDACGAPALSFVRVGRAYGDKVALRDITFDIAPGSRTAIVGPSGSGKSSLLNIAAGLDTRFVGSIQRVPQRPSVGYAFQEHRLLPWLSARGNIEFALTAADWPRDTLRERAEQMLDLVDLSAVAGAYPATLSGGMRQRVSLARAVAVRPVLLLLDEPFAAIDEAHADRLCARLRQEVSDTAATALMVTHRYREASQFADRAIILSNGSVRADLSFDRSGYDDEDSAVAIENRLRAAGTPAMIDEFR